MRLDASALTGGLMFVKGHRYTRDEIHAVVGGSKQTFLPTKDRHVVCVCIQKELNPKAPAVVLVGNGANRVRAAEWFAAQSAAVPVFLKHKTNVWEYLGDYRVQGATTDPTTIRAESAAAGRNDVKMVLFLTP